MTLVLRSLPAKTIPRTLPVTLNTANDHIKTIFAKAGVGSRGDLMATVFRSSADGTPLRIWACIGDANQQWNVPS
jgi:hypothetical protein